MLRWEWTLVEDSRGYYYILDSRDGTLINWGMTFAMATLATEKWYNDQQRLPNWI